MKENLMQIKKDAEYCLNCKNKPCVSGCPLNNNIPDFIKNIKEEKYDEAYKVLSMTTIFEPICGRICPHKSQCEGKCTRGIKSDSVNIGKLEAFIGDYALENVKIDNTLDKKKEKIAIIGSGPSGIACAYYLSNNGYEVSIYEKHSELGGLLRYGIPDFRLNKKLLDKWLKKIVLNSNITVNTNMALGKDFTLEDLKKKYDKIVLAFGANISNKMDIEGKNNEFVIGGNELLEYMNGPDFSKTKVVVIGGGNVAMDVARTIKRMGAEETIIAYRRSKEELPAELKEIEDAKKERIKFLFQTNVIKILEKQIECVKTKLIKKDGETRMYPIDIPNSNFIIDVDYVVFAIGSSTDEKTIKNLNIQVDNKGYINTDECYRTSEKNVYAIGDLSGAKRTVAWAAKSGFECAKQIIKE